MIQFSETEHYVGETRSPKKVHSPPLTPLEWLRNNFSSRRKAPIASFRKHLFIPEEGLRLADPLCVDVAHDVVALGTL